MFRTADFGAASKSLCKKDRVQLDSGLSVSPSLAELRAPSLSVTVGTSFSAIPSVSMSVSDSESGSILMTNSESVAGLSSVAVSLLPCPSSLLTGGWTSAGVSLLTGGWTSAGVSLPATPAIPT